MASSPTALVTGGSRGIGAATGITLANRGYDVALTYRNKAARAEEVAGSIARIGVRSLAIRCDITVEEDLEALFATLRHWTSHLDLLVLNASGGLERDILASDPAYPMRLNRDGQVRLLEHSIPLMMPGSTVVFVTSHWAHLYGRIEQLPSYAPVAETKWAGEQALRARVPALAVCGIRLIVVTGDLVEGTITPRLLERGAPGLARQRRESIGRLPTADEMGEAIAAAATDPSLPTGQTVVVGGTLESLLR